MVLFHFNAYLDIFIGTTRKATFHKIAEFPPPLMAQYLLSLLASGPRGSGSPLSGHPLFGHMGGALFGGLDDLPGTGRMGDYVFTQDGSFHLLDFFILYF